MSGGKPVIFFDLETTGLDTRNCDIIQLAAISGGHSFNRYMVPAAPICETAMQLTGFNVQNGALFWHNTAMPTVTLHEALTSFLTFLRSFRSPVLLAAHNGKRFDVPILTRVLRSCSLLDDFERLGTSYLDTLLLVRDLFRLESYSQKSLVQLFLGKDYDAHNALEDVKALQELYRRWNPNPESKSGGKPVIFFDLETTGLDGNCDIIQLAAVSGGRSFNRYMVPAAPICETAMQLTGFSVQNGALFWHNTAMPTVTLHEALTSFLTFLRSFQSPVLLAAHNGKQFDVPILTRALRSCSLLDEFEGLGTRYLDTLLLARDLYRSEKSYSQKSLVQRFLGKDYDAHNALEDVKALQELYRRWNPNPESMSGGKPVIFFDLETTGLDRNCDIIQLAAISGGRSFNRYMVPAAPICETAMQLTGFSVQNGALFRHYTAMPTVTLHEALTSFLTFLRSFRSPVLLAAHNGKQFDVPILTRALRSCSLLDEFERLGTRYLDTLLLARDLFRLENYKQKSLVQLFLGKDYDAHNALEDMSGGKPVIFFDLETTGLGGNCDIIQLAAVSGGRSFNAYMVPAAPISAKAMQLTGFSVQNGALFQHYTAMPTVTLYEALTSFLTFLRSFRSPVVLAAHNGKRFDVPILTRALWNCSLLDDFERLGTSYLDTLLLARDLFRLESYSQKSLVQLFLGKDYDAHNALGDVKALQDLYMCWNPNPESLNTRNCDIIQLAAISGGRSFNTYMVPTAPICETAMQLTGFNVQNGALFWHYTAMPTVTLHEALTSFLTFLRSFRPPVLLAAHNGKYFDVPILTRALRSCSLLDDFERLGTSYLDTLLLARDLFRAEKSYSQKSLVQRFLGKDYDAHNALEDVKALQELYRRWDRNPESLIRCMF
ncbi:DNA polymerase III PolC-type [Merluccius polli]|uniref:exodeoxyribonuclease III n=1 Tax=Merluccius polli TaxID=89951 RepID=A0AA47MI68_MERPO|nr:DNA polymerase III PolC-type [Merluccius polli]